MPSLDPEQDWFTALEAELRRPQPERGQAMRQLVDRIGNEPALHDRARTIFVEAIARDDDPWTLTAAALGLEAIADPVIAKATWRALLLRADEHVVAQAVVSIRNRELVPALLDVLSRRREPHIRINTVVHLGLLGQRGADGVYEALVVELADPAVRPYAVAALGDLGDARAVRALQAHLRDRSPAWPVDNHGPMLTVGEVAREALAKLQPGTCPTPQAPPSVQKSQFGHWLCHVPLAIAILEVVWLGVLTENSRAANGGRGPTAADHHRLDLLGAIPPLAALVLAGFAVARRSARGKFDLVVLVSGVLLCLTWLGLFASELLD